MNHGPGPPPARLLLAWRLSLMTPEPARHVGMAAGVAAHPEQKAPSRVYIGPGGLARPHKELAGWVQGIRRGRAAPGLCAHGSGIHKPFQRQEYQAGEYEPFPDLAGAAAP